MSHKPGGYFYYRYTYMCPWTDTAGQSGTDNTYHSAVYTPARKQDHTAQTTWYNNTAMPAVKADIEKNFYGDADRNRQGRTYERYNQQYVRQEQFMWCSKLPTHTTAGWETVPFGKQV
jgi:hypothetical protein